MLQLDQVACLHEGLPQVPSPRYVPSQLELENDNIILMLQAAHGDADISDKEMQIIHMEFMRERDAKLNHPDSQSMI